MGFNTIFKSSLNQRGYEPLSLENGSFVNSDVLMPPTWHCYEIVQNSTVMRVQEEM